MTTINLRELYPWYTEDAFIEVSDEVAAFLEEDRRQKKKALGSAGSCYRN